MKIKISFEPSEEAQVSVIVNAIKKLKPLLKIKVSDKHPPYKQMYIAFGNKKKTPNDF